MKLLHDINFWIQLRKPSPLRKIGQNHNFKVQMCYRFMLNKDLC